MFRKKKNLVIFNKNNYPTIYKTYEKIAKQMCLFLSVLMVISNYINTVAVI